MQKPIAVALSGCGALDGSEIQEATLTLLALIAPDNLINVSYRAESPAKARV